MLVLSPHCDLHVALHGAPTLRIRVDRRDLASDGMSHTLAEVTPQCTFDFFAPYNPVGNRLQAFVTIDRDTGVVTPTAVGINLVQVRVAGRSIVFRIQVHDTILGWWFGHSSITTARDAKFGHTLPSIYALFSEDTYPTDRVGDISGHGYVPLQSDNTSFVIAPNGRLRGVTEGSGTLTGSFLGVTHQLPVRVVDYARTRQTLQSVRSVDRSHPENVHNILFLAEGFRDLPADRERFDEIVARTVDRMFSTARHEPYGLLGGSFNVWKAFEPSVQHALTCGYRVNDEEIPRLGTGYPFAPTSAVSKNEKNYTLSQLVPVVGLPLRNESRTTAQLKALWETQSLSNLQPGRIDDAVVTAWKFQKAVGILEARDTFFGLHLGMRYADRFGDQSPVEPPASDSPSDAQLAPFVRRVYGWFSLHLTRHMELDPRRHPPELLRGGTESLGNSVLAYIRNLRDAEAPHAPVGQEWMPDASPDPVFRRSRGLIAIIANDALFGGTNFNALTLTACTLNTAGRVRFQYANAGNERVMRRVPPDTIDLDLQHVIAAVAHEFGHSFRLGDEDEDDPRDEPDLVLGSDNLTSLSAIQHDANFRTNRKLDPDKVKWFSLHRIEVSDVLLAPSQAAGAVMRVRIDPGQIGKWVEAQTQGLVVYLRHSNLPVDGRQLPLPTDPQHFLPELGIVDTIDEATGTIPLGGPHMPSPPPVFPAGAVLYIPTADPESALPLFVVEKKVVELLRSTNLPLNQDPDRSVPNKFKDTPVAIPGMLRPCKRHKLVGVYEGGLHVTGMVYRPTGLCKMRRASDGEFCFVCKYLIVNRVNPSLHALLDAHYPAPKKRDA